MMLWLIASIWVFYEIYEILTTVRALIKSMNLKQEFALYCFRLIQDALIVMKSLSNSGKEEICWHLCIVRIVLSSINPMQCFLQVPSKKTKPKSMGTLAHVWVNQSTESYTDRQWIFNKVTKQLYLWANGGPLLPAQFPPLQGPCLSAYIQPSTESFLVESTNNYFLHLCYTCS